MASKKVLVIDDEKLLVRSICMGLRFRGMETEQALDGESGLETAKTTAPDIILLDIMMPRLDGWEVLQRLKEDPATADIPVIVFTAREYRDGSELARERGAAAFIAKPFEMDDLVEVMLANMNGGR